MTNHHSGNAITRLGRIAALGAVVLLGACEKRLPTSAEIDEMDVAGAERITTSARIFHVARRASLVEFYVDGQKVTREEAASLPGNVILSMRMTKIDVAGDTIITRITTDGTRERDPAAEAADLRRLLAMRKAQMAADSARGPEALRADVEAVEAKLSAAEAEATRKEGPSSQPRFMRTSNNGFMGLVVIDGIVSTSEALIALDPMRIVETEVLKDRVAIRVSSDPRAAYGIVKVTTRR